jgi:hypothetical protein
MRIRCCSFSISPQTHKSFGSPHVVQTSAMNLTLCMVTEIYKSFKGVGMFLGVVNWVWLVAVRCCWLRLVAVSHFPWLFVSKTELKRL